MCVCAWNSVAFVRRFLIERESSGGRGGSICDGCSLSGGFAGEMKIVAVAYAMRSFGVIEFFVSSNHYFFYVHIL